MRLRWNDWNEEHIAVHDVSPGEAEDVVLGARAPFPLVQDDEKYLVWGPAEDGRLLQVVFVIDSDDSVFVIQARPLTESEKRRYLTEGQMSANGAKKRKWSRLNVRQLAESTAAYDREMAVDEFKPLTPESRRRWARARRKPGRPRRGKGAKVISVSVEKGLLSRSDILAKDLGVTRAGLIERGLKAVLAAEGKL